MTRRVDAIVLGAGIVGVSTAMHLQRRGKDVALVDRRPPGEEASAGNSGLVVREMFLPLTVPGDLKTLADYALNRSIAVRVQPSFVPAILPWLLKVRRHSCGPAIDRFAGAMAVPARYAYAEHKVLADQADARNYYRETGWIRLYRTAEGFAATEELCHQARVHGLDYKVYGPQDLGNVEPDLRPVFHKAMHFTDTVSVSDPGAVTKAFAAAFYNSGGSMVIGDAASLGEEEGLWHIDTSEGTIEARCVVIALGAWSSDVLERLGYRYPFAVMRGYHRHLAAEGAARLSRPVVDVENGFVLAPMTAGIRITSGLEFAHRDAPPDAAQIDAALSIARHLFPLGEALEEHPWMGSRPSLPDSLPMIGPAPRHRGLWINTGHGQYGFTLGPFSGRLLADRIGGRRTLCDPAPFDPARFGG